MQWTISQLERTVSNGVVSVAHWRVSHTEDGFTGSSYGTVSLPAKDPSDPTFVPYENLTEAQVIEWVKDALGAGYVASREADVLSQINAQKNPIVLVGTPW